MHKWKGESMIMSMVLAYGIFVAACGLAVVVALIIKKRSANNKEPKRQ
jgi:hypothetical protein